MINLIPLAHAAADETVNIGAEANQGGFFGYTCVSNLISNIVSVVFIIGAIAVFVYLVLGGIEWLTSGGDKAKVEYAQKIITNALIGLAIIAASYAIYTLVLDFFGIDLSKLCDANPI